jgi:hypothetical protein
MTKLFIIIALLLAASPAVAHPGSHHCHINVCH